MTRTVTILGGTGTIGDNMLDLLRQHKDTASLYGLSAFNNVEKLIRIIQEFSPKVVAIPSMPEESDLKKICAEKQIELLIGEGAIDELAARKVGLVVGAIVGMAGLSSVMAAVKAGQTIALANKESLVAAGHLVMPALGQYGAKIIPVDSEHNAIHQCLMGQERDAVKMITLTASGGPFLRLSSDEIKSVTKADALAHPNWVMGAKVSIDSASMMNKGLELLEASHLFGAAQKQLSAVIHPQSLVHGFVEYFDGSVIAHLASADMKLPLGFALGLETRIETGTKPLRLTEIAQLDFIEIDRDKFPCFAFAEQVIDEGPEKAIILNAANEIAVEAFLHDQIAFHQIATIVGKALDDKSDGDASSLEGVFDLDKKARLLALSYFQTL